MSIRAVHRIAATTALGIIIVFFSSTVIVELAGGHEAIAVVKRCIVYGLILLVPAIATTGITGTVLGRSRVGPLVAAKKRRMPVIAANGVIVLVPSALVLNYLASSESFGGLFYAVQALELLAGAINITLMSSNLRDGRRLGRHRD